MTPPTRGNLTQWIRLKGANPRFPSKPSSSETDGGEHPTPVRKGSEKEGVAVRPVRKNWVLITVGLVSMVAMGCGGAAPRAEDYISDKPNISVGSDKQKSDGKVSSQVTVDGRIDSTPPPSFGFDPNTIALATESLTEGNCPLILTLVCGMPSFDPDGLMVACQDRGLNQFNLRVETAGVERFAATLSDRALFQPAEDRLTFSVSHPCTGEDITGDFAPFNLNLVLTQGEHQVQFESEVRLQWQ